MEQVQINKSEKFIALQKAIMRLGDLEQTQKAHDSLLEYAVENKYDDLFTVDNKGTRNGSVRIMKKEFVGSGEISRRVGSYVDNCTNVHSEQDLIDAEANIKIKERLYELGNEGE